MVSEKTKKYMGIFIAIAMAGSLIAAGFMYMDPNEPLVNADPNLILDAQPSTFTYDISFETVVLSELNSVRLAAKTTSTNKNDIDITIRTLEEVSRVSSSQFVKSEDGWYYLAEIEFKRNTDISNAVSKILSLSYFDGANEVMKRVTINTPNSTTIYNTELGIDRIYIFQYQTTVALVSINTQAQDEIIVSGKITLQGNTITSLELNEQENITNKGSDYTEELTLAISNLSNELFFQGSLDSNLIQEELETNLKEIDQNSQIFFFDIGQEVMFFGQSTLDNYNEINSLFLDAKDIDFKQSATFELNEIFLSQLNETITLNKNEFETQVSIGKNINDEVNLELTINISKNGAEIINAIEK